MKIFIGGSRPRKFMPFAWLIQRYSGSKISHNYTKYQDTLTGQWMISESSHGEAHKMVFEKWHLDNEIIEEFSIDVEESVFINIMTRINHALQTSYSELNIFGIPFYDLYEKTNIRFFNFIASLFSDGVGSVICSEEASYTLNIIGIKFKRPNDFLVPSEVIKKLKQLSQTEVYIERSI